MWGIMKDYRWLFSKALKILLHPAALHACNVDKTSRVCSKSELTNCEVDKFTYIGYGCFMVNTKIGRFCSIADRVSIGGAMHPMQYVSTSPVFHAGYGIRLSGGYDAFRSVADKPSMLIVDLKCIGTACSALITPI